MKEIFPGLLRVQGILSVLGVLYYGFAALPAGAGSKVLFVQTITIMVAAVVGIVAFLFWEGLRAWVLSTFETEKRLKAIEQLLKKEKAP